jgi:hypothetical protein
MTEVRADPGNVTSARGRYVAVMAIGTEALTKVLLPHVLRAHLRT